MNEFHDYGQLPRLICGLNTNNQILTVVTMLRAALANAAALDDILLFSYCTDWQCPKSCDNQLSLYIWNDVRKPRNNRFSN